MRQVATPEQQAELDSSSLDSYLLDTERERGRRRELIAAREEPSLDAFLPGAGTGAQPLGLRPRSLPDLPAEVQVRPGLRNPTEPTINQRFGILIHNVLERFHKEKMGQGADGLPRLISLFEAGWRRGFRRQR